jgi:rare lipoprotein A
LGCVVTDLLATRSLQSFFLLLVAGIFVLGGCAAHHAAADHPAGISQPNAASGEPGAASSSSAPSPASAAPTASAPAAKRSKPPAIPPPEGYVEEGNASWYGVPFHGRRASNGEIYDMHKLTAAHRTLPFDTQVRVTNLNNGKSTTVRITDRGPFVEGRIIDLSMAAAQEIESVGPGVVPVRLEVLTPGVDVTGGFFTVQVGAFRDPANAQRLRERLSASYSPIFVQQYDTAEGLYYRVRVGKVAGEDAARQLGEQLRQREGFTPFVVRLDEGAGTGGTQ